MVQLSKAKKRYLLWGVSLLSFTGFLDATIVSTALPDIQTSLNMSVTQLQWIMNAFFLGVSAFMASMGRLGDIYGRRKVFYVGTLIFGLASIGAGLATSSLQLIICRAFQGITTAITIPVGVAIIQAAHDKHELAKVMSVFGTITGAGLALGPVVGGILVTVFGWPAIFFVNIPFVILGFVLCLISVQESRSETKMTLDYFGIVFLSLTITGLVYAMVEANSLGWGSPQVVISFVICLISLILLILVERSVQYPIMAGYLFKNRVFVPAMLFSFLAGSMMSVILFIDPLYLHVILQQSNLMTGIILFIIPLCVVISSAVIGYVHKYLGSKRLMIFGTTGFIITALLHMTFGVQLIYSIVVPAFVCMGIGWGIMNTVPGTAIGENFDSDHVGVAIGALFSFFNIGAAVLLALSVVIFHVKAFGYLAGQFAVQHLAFSQADKLNVNKFVGQPDQMQHIASQLGMKYSTALHLLKQSFVTGMHQMFWPLIALAIIALTALVLVMKK